MKSVRKTAWLAIVLALITCTGCRDVVLRVTARKFLTTGPNGPETPKDFGIPFEHASIPSEDRRELDAFLVTAPQTCAARPAILIFHGVGETISLWVKAQKYLYDHCVSSMVFDYSGHGNSSRPGTVENVGEDSIAAYQYFLSKFPSGTRCVFAFSLGSGPMLDSIHNFRPVPSCVVLASAFTSIRDASRHRGTPEWETYVVPDVWNNLKNVAKVHAPLLVIHSDDDNVNPLDGAKRVFDAAYEPKQWVEVHDVPHNAPFKDPNDAFWAPVLKFIAQ